MDTVTDTDMETDMDAYVAEPSVYEVVVKWNLRLKKQINTNEVICVT